MIDWLDISQLAIADHVQLEFGGSFTTVTGETGSGKSLIVGAIGLLLGDRCDNSLIRAGQDSADIQGGFHLHPDHPAHRWLSDHELDNDGECILRRSIRRDRPSRGYINGHAVTATQLRQLGGELVDIHGQHEHHSLLQRATQLTLVDRSAGIEQQVTELGDCYVELSTVEQEIESVANASAQTAERADLLTFQLGELDQLDPLEGEWADLAARQKRLQHQQDLVAGVAALDEQLAGGEQAGIGDTLGQCLQQLDQLVDYDGRLQAIADMLREASVNVDEAARQLQDLYRDDVPDAEEMDRIEKRFARFHDLSRKHRVPPEGLPALVQTLRTELDGLENPEAALARLEERRKSAKRAYDKLAGRITTRRKTAARKLSEQVTALLQELGLKGAKFAATLIPTEPGTISRHGAESVEFQVAINAGASLTPLAKTASGGELSRISLAIQVVLAEAATVSTLVFDEVDVGIGGRVAGLVGEKLRELGESRQVICITHLSQVAARGHAHWSVSKQGGKEVNVQVEPLDEAGRVEEIARMSAGAELTPESLAHAEQLLKSA